MKSLSEICPAKIMIIIVLKGPVIPIVVKLII